MADSADTHTNVTCHECSLRVAVSPLEHGQKALCPRCGFQLTVFREYATDRILAYSSAALIFLAASLPFEFLAFSAQGRQHSIGISDSIAILLSNDYLLLAVILSLTILILPALVLSGLLYLHTAVRLESRLPLVDKVFSGVFNLLPWCMAEIFMVGILVSLIKLTDLADVSLGLSFYAYVLFTLAMLAALLYLDRHQLRQSLPQLETLEHSELDPDRSIQHTWALLLTAMLLYIPSNTMPIMNTRLLGNDDPSTIMGGVVLLWQLGSYPVALIIFIASVFIPVVKLVILCWLTFSVQKGWVDTQQERVFWYRVTEFVGRWSMVDVFVVAVLVSLVQLGNTVSIYPGPAVLAFSGVVIITMLAAITFDTRLIWLDSHGRTKQ